jgi:sugar lactone lactonase YvrE
MEGTEMTGDAVACTTEQALLGEGTRMNDAACDPQGRFWAGTKADAAGAAALYRFDGDATGRPVAPFRPDPTWWLADPDGPADAGGRS